MGNCLSSCLPSCGNQGAPCNFTMLTNSRSDFSFLIDERTSEENNEKRSFLSRFLERHKSRQKKKSAGVVAGLVNPQLSYQRLPESQRVSPQSSYASKDIQLQCLDARALLGRTDTATPENSLDLEWEHETLPVSMVHEPSGSSWGTTIFPEDPLTSQPNQENLMNTDSDYSRVSSSANSLEWDSVQNSIHSEVDTVDTDTQFLLNEIDRLTRQALEETGMISVSEDVTYLDDSL
ncbi:uncharacterized protein LOC126735757 isoform X1 [Anthonomus grandis grandis]|uniref:uncharacterized protein LOC126735757 isoform X1 n=1 Tax=Anthonomus grandis grandis TaxID=2921223 RepID=UPI002165CB9C|nr:uncharacterized protein LOC126735757 isoform X1 [Anthonomus grandis grandis]